MIDKSDIVLLSVEEELQSVEQKSDKATEDRNVAREVLREAVSLIKFTPEDVRDGKTSKAMLNILKAYTDTAKDEEASAHKRVSSKLRLKEVNSSEQQNEAVQALIMSVTSSDDSKDLDDAAPIEDTELNLDPDIESTISETELRDDPNDVSF